MNSPAVPELALKQRGEFWIGEFRAMASPCEVHVEHPSKQYATGLIKMAMQEALRIEAAFSRYRTDNELHRINTSNGKAVVVSEEMARLLDFAQVCFDASNGLFDVTSGVFREAWRFDGSPNVPQQCEIDALLTRIGWQKVRWQAPSFLLPKGMQIDLGGIGKEYAVDRSTILLNAVAPEVPCLINFGGDLRVNRAPISKATWQVGVSRSGRYFHDSSAERFQDSLSLQIAGGALTTSGDAQRYLEKDGVKYGHVLNPLTGWPEPHAPSSITVAGDSCIQAGILSTLGMLQGANAEQYLSEQSVQFWCQR